MLQELLERTSLATALGLWQGDTAPRVWYEPYRGLFDLALADAQPRVLIELKVGADVGEHQRRRQRVYVLLGTAFFAALDEPDARNIGAPELAAAIGTGLDGQDGAVGDLGRAYLERLEADALVWQSEHDPTSGSGLDLFRLYVAMASAWPVEVRPTKVTHPGGPDWIINADAWTTCDVQGWKPATFYYWEMVNGRTRFKLLWEGDIAQRLDARTAYRAALERAATELGEPVGRTRTRAGKYMTALELASDARVEVLMEGRVSAERSRALYDRATALFLRGLELLPERQDR